MLSLDGYLGACDAPRALIWAWPHLLSERTDETSYDAQACWSDALVVEEGVSSVTQEREGGNVLGGITTLS